MRSRGLLSPATLARAFESERDALLCRDHDWKELRNRPMRWAIAILGLCRWVPLSPFSFRRPDRSVVSFTDVPEVLLKKIVEHDYTQHLLNTCLLGFEDWRLNVSPNGLWTEPPPYRSPF